MHETVLSLTQRAKANSLVSESGEADAMTHQYQLNLQFVASAAIYNQYLSVR